MSNAWNEIAHKPTLTSQSIREILVFLTCSSDIRSHSSFKGHYATLCVASSGAPYEEVVQIGGFSRGATDMDPLCDNDYLRIYILF